MNTDRITRPALKYYGGKWNLAPWIIDHFPEHSHYIEPCFGAGSILLRKPVSDLETVNDINGRLVNFFSILRDNPIELIQKVNLTPWAEDEYKLSQQLSKDSIEDARRFFFMAWMSVNGAPLPTGFRTSKKRGGRGTTPPQDTIRHVLDRIAPRLRHVQIRNIDAIEFIEKYNKDSGGLIYFDPPYPQFTRTSIGYGEFDDFDNMHQAAAELLLESPGFVVVSGYKCSLYEELYEEHGWTRIDKIAHAQSNKKRVESIWLSPRTISALYNKKSAKNQQKLDMPDFAMDYDE